MMFELQPSARAILCNSMLLPLVSNMEMVLISSIKITCLTAVIKSILLILVLLNSLQLFYECCNVHKLRN